VVYVKPVLWTIDVRAVARSSGKRNLHLAFRKTTLGHLLWEGL